ncbi:MAG: Bax inhibitor-1/YccA family protein [Gammaproteobacteria bacterium]
MADYDAFKTAPTAVRGLADTRVSDFLKRVYGWMFVGLAVTAGVAMYVASQPALVQAIVSSRVLFFGLVIAELGLVFWISARVASLAPATAAGLFLLYSALNGVTLSVVLLAFTGASIASAFVTTAGMFGALALYGTLTKRSLTGLGQFAFMGLIGIVIASLVGMFWQNSALQFLISAVGVIVFTGLTAYDAQRLKAMALQVDGSQAQSYAVGGALALYLDFINLFLMLLRLFGDRR